MKKLMILGGSSYIVPVIKTAHRLGIYVITCDYLPDNVAHKYADEYCNVSVIDKEAVLRKAMELSIDGICSFACDPGVVTAAYVAEQMGLPFQCSYETARILQDKGLFREFLLNHGFNSPHARSYTDKQAPFADLGCFTWPVIVKPVDSAGSKGVSKVECAEDLPAAIEAAVKNSHSGAFIIEDFITLEGYRSSTDPFTVDGKLAFMTYSDQLFDGTVENPYTPTAEIWPSSMKQEYQTYLTSEIQRLFDLLQVKSGIYNIETCVGVGGIPYIMEVSPRGGGNKLAELQDMAYGVNLIENEVRHAVGMPLKEIGHKDLNGAWGSVLLCAHAGTGGRLKKIWFDKEIEKNYVKLVAIRASHGDVVEPLSGANKALGDFFVKCNSRQHLETLLSKREEWLHIELE